MKMEVLKESFFHLKALQQIAITMFASHKTRQLVLGHKRYILEQPCIGKGTYGQVYKSLDEQKKQIIAIKILDLNKAIEEANVHKNLQHSAIIGYIDSFFSESQRKGYIMMEYFEGKTLDKMIKFFKEKVERRNIGSLGLPEKIVIQIFRELLKGFQYMHELGITHCDIKPENIMVNHQGMVKIIDLGLASSDLNSNLGTPMYIAPQCIEQQTQRPSGSRDVWSLGLVLYEMLTGNFCYEQLIGPKRSRQTNEQFKQRILLFLQNYRLNVEYNEYYDPFWQSITMEMLNFKACSRPTMKRIAEEMQIQMHSLDGQHQLEQNYRQLFRTDLLTQNYYGETNIHPSGILRSETIVNKVIIYLKFFHLKYRFLPKYCQLLATHQEKAKFPFISNLSKYCLIFLALALYLRSIKQLLSRLSKKKLRIDFEHENISKNVQEELFTQRDLQKVHKIYQGYISFYQEQFDLFQAKLHNKILPKLKQKLSQPNDLNEKLKNKFKNLLDDVGDYEQIYRSRILDIFKSFKKNCNIGDQKLLVYSYTPDLAIHYLTIIISKLDAFFENSQVACLAEISQLYLTLGGARDKDERIIRKYLLEHIRKERSSH